MIAVLVAILVAIVACLLAVAWHVADGIADACEHEEQDEMTAREHARPWRGHVDLLPRP